MLRESFSTRDVLELTGTTARQLQWWDERRIVVPAREGRKRVYSAADLVDILVIEELRHRHISLQQVRRVLRFLHQELHTRLAELVRGEVEQHLLLDGKRIYLRTNSEQVVDLMRNTRQPVLLICVSDAVRRLRVDLSSLPMEQLERKPVGAMNGKGRRSQKPASA